MSLKMYPDKMKPREKAFEKGVESLTDIELLAIFLRTGIKGNDVLLLANSIIEQAGGCLSKIVNLDIDDLIKINGIGKTKAIELLALIQLSKRINQISIENFIYVNNPNVIYELYTKRFEYVSQEHFMILSLNAKNAIVDEHVVFIGTLSQSLIHPREIFKRIVLMSASSFICVHNHPSGDATPSKNDMEVTSHLNDAAKLFAIPLLDHIIIGKNSYFSFKENNLI
ncbi:DNA repair protein RadC [Bacilli bacterium PM5-3]|nr:DNA repair protein RadC [Bacilli bacterium PM5-3]MDH6603249.1 DNA repair protein RadC [Bacilli bacterium PM5-9]